MQHYENSNSKGDGRMNRPKLIMMCGLPGSGKSTFAKSLAEKCDANIHSSDALREELLEDINDQTNNELVFQTLHQRIKDDLKNGKSCIYDACQVTYKSRMSFLQQLNKIPCEKICVIMATPYEVCLERSQKRERKVPERVIKRMYMKFDPPWYYEGWDNIWVEYAPGSENSLGWAREWVENMKDYNQENPHHALTLGEHCWQAVKYINQSTPDSSSPTELICATMIHDCGKIFCKTFINTKGEVTEYAHYYGHEHTGSYDSLFYEVHCYNLRVAVLVRWHMQPYFWEKNHNEKQHDKYRKLWGENLYKDIMQLHFADKNAH